MPDPRNSPRTPPRNDPENLPRNLVPRNPDDGPSARPVASPAVAPPAHDGRVDVTNGVRLNHRDLYMLIAGLVLGLLLGPAVLGRLAPETYQRHFGTIENAIIKLTVHDVSRQQVRQQIQSAGVDPDSPMASSALGDFERRHAVDRLPYVQAVRQARLNQGRLIAVIIAVVVMMIIETLPDARSTTLRSRLATARYALVALTLALLMAQPSLWLGLPVVFLALLLAIALGAALVPLSRRPRQVH